MHFWRSFGRCSATRDSDIEARCENKGALPKTHQSRLFRSRTILADRPSARRQQGRSRSSRDVRHPFFSVRCHYAHGTRILHHPTQLLRGLPRIPRCPCSRAQRYRRAPRAIANALKNGSLAARPHLRGANPRHSGRSLRSRRLHARVGIRSIPLVLCAITGPDGRKPAPPHRAAYPHDRSPAGPCVVRASRLRTIPCQKQATARPWLSS